MGFTTFTTFPKNDMDGKQWTRPSFTSLTKECSEDTPISYKKKFNSISSLVEEQVKEIPKHYIPHNRPKSRFNSISSLVEEQSPRNSISSLVQEESARNSISSPVEEEPKPTTPRFSMFGKKANITEINNRSLEEDQKVLIKKKRFSGKFEYHSPKKRKVVSFHPLFLERVCLFLEEQSPCELKEAHDKQLTNPPFRIICSHWPQDTTTIMDKKSFSISPDNRCIRGRLMIRNLALDKSVLIRYTLDAWTTVRDVDAAFFGPNPKNTAYDIYEFTMDLDLRQLADRGTVRGKLEFAVRCTMGELDYWDNNDDKNYQIKIISDPLNDPWKRYKKEDSEEEEEVVEEEKVEKHSQFANALKGYKHAKPYHLNRRQPWLGTRYDFSQSLYLAKIAPYDTWTPTPPATLMPEPPEYIQEHPVVVSRPPSPTASPPIPSPNSLEFNSDVYLDLLHKYCFYTPKEDTPLQTQMQPFVQEEQDTLFQ